jgi:hypothetical protein
MTSTIKVNNLQNQCGANIINENAGTITIGASGDTIALAAGASQSGFSRTGTVNWDTTSKTTGFTGVSGNGYFCDTTSAAFTVTLPATPSGGDIVAVADYNGTAGTNNITVGRNSSNINGSATDFKISINYASISFVYVDATAGWRSVDTSNIADVQNTYVAATGGTITTCGDFKIHTFTGPGIFTVTNTGTPLGSNTVDYMVVAGGGGGGGVCGGGGGGAGGFRETTGCGYTSSPLGACVAALPVSIQGYPVTVGGGGSASGPGNNVPGGTGSNSVFSTITSNGGGGGNSFVPDGPAGSGGSGGGGGGRGNDGGGAGNTPPTSPPQGNSGGNSAPGGSPPGIDSGGGGGGATAAGASAGNSSGGNGGAGATTSISGTPTAYAGGGGGGSEEGSIGSGGSGGGADGVTGSNPANAGTVNTGGGGGGVGSGSCGGNAGGSGIVIIRYKYQ